MANKSDSVGALIKGLRIIEAFTAERPRLSITDVADKLELERATARRYLLTLHEQGYASYDGKFFSLTPRVLRLGIGALAGLPLAQIVQPWLDQLSDRIGQSTSVSILDETEIVYIARAAQRRVMSIGLMPGSRLPAHCTSMGRVLLAALPEAEMLAIVERSDLSPRTANSISNLSEVIARIAQARSEGYALVDQEVEVGLRSIAVPLYTVHGRIIAALNTGVAAIQPDPNALADQYLPALTETREGLRRVLRA